MNCEDCGKPLTNGTNAMAGCSNQKCASFDPIAELNLILAGSEEGDTDREALCCGADLLGNDPHGPGCPAEHRFLSRTILERREEADEVGAMDLLRDNEDDDVRDWVRNANVGDMQAFGHSVLERIA